MTRRLVYITTWSPKSN